LQDDVEDAQEMLEYTQDAIRVAKKGVMRQASMNSADPRMLIQKTPFLFMAAAVSDFKPKYPQKGKLKKSALGDTWSLELVQTPDILSSLNKDGIRTVAFKAEMDAQNGLENAKALLRQKEVDAVCYNLLEDSSSFGTDENEITFITATKTTPLGKADKLTLAQSILNVSKSLAND
jgi:phosphopantothenoylcysteine decarboxylase/phosphopantothenate--cysteine ligase